MEKVVTAVRASRYMRTGVFLVVLSLLVAPFLPFLTTIPAAAGVPTITITYHYNQPFAKLDMEKYIDQGRETLRERGVNVKLKVNTWCCDDEDYKAKMALALNSGTASDLTQLDGFWLPAFASAGYLMPLPTEEWNEWESFYPPMQLSVSYKDKVYGAMYDTDVRLLYYNRKVFRDAGLPDPWEPKTWDDLLYALRTIKEKCPGVVPFAAPIVSAEGEATTMQNFEMLYLGSVPKASIESGTWLYDPEKGQWIVRRKSLIDTLDLLRTIYVDENLGDAMGALEAGSLGWKRRTEGLRDGKIGVILDGSWHYAWSWGSDGPCPWPNRDKELGWAPLPGSGKPGTPPIACISGGWCWAVNSKAKNPDLAFEVLKALEGKEALSVHNSFSAHIAPRNDVELSEAYTKEPIAIEFNERAGERLLPHTTYRPGVPEYPKVSSLIWRMVEAVCTGDKTPQQAYRSFISRMNRTVGADHVAIE